MTAREHARRGSASMPSGLEPDAVAKISATLTALLADVFALYVKTKNFYNDKEFVAAQDMLTELCEHNAQLAVRLRSAHSLCDQFGDVATASLIEMWIDETERRVGFLQRALAPKAGSRR
jgi:DNA-binding ferritin-like protein